MAVALPAAPVLGLLISTAALGESIDAPLLVGAVRIGAGFDSQPGWRPRLSSSRAENAQRVG
jgi:hypothetical protein